MKKLGILTLICSLILSSTAFAHERYYVWTEIYETLPKDGKEIEYWTTLTVPDGSATNFNSWEYRGEIEYGLTDRLTIAHYEHWQTDNQHGLDDDGASLKDSTRYTGFNFEAKYRFFEKGKFIVDPLLYLEWETNPQERNHPNSIETKFVLSKDLGKLNVTYNQIIDAELSNSGRTKHEFAAAASYPVKPWLRPGIELQGTMWNPETHRNEFALGPTVQISTQWFWLATGVAFGVNSQTDNVQARCIVGIPF